MDADNYPTDAERYVALCELIEKSVSGGIDINDDRLCYDEPDPGKRVRVYCYPNTPVSFIEWHGDTVNEAVDLMIRSEAAKRIRARITRPTTSNVEDDGIEYV